RVAYRSGPLMEALGGFAIAGALVYGGFRVLQTGATPGQFFSFLAAFMLAYEPAQGLARLHIELNSGPGGSAYPVQHHRRAGKEARGYEQAVAQDHRGADRLPGRAVQLPAAGSHD